MGIVTQFIDNSKGITMAQVFSDQPCRTLYISECYT